MLVLVDLGGVVLSLVLGVAHMGECLEARAGEAGKTGGGGRGKTRWRAMRGKALVGTRSTCCEGQAC